MSERTQPDFWSHARAAPRRAPKAGDLTTNLVAEIAATRFDGPWGGCFAP
jgi:hypothetical protein